MVGIVLFLALDSYINQGLGTIVWFPPSPPDINRKVSHLGGWLFYAFSIWQLILFIKII